MLNTRCRREKWKKRNKRRSPDVLLCNNQAASEVDVDLNQVTLPCTDYECTVKFYSQMGFRLIVDSPPGYARFETMKGTTFSVHLSQSQDANADFVVYFEVDDVDVVVAQLKEKGLEFEVEPVDQEWLWREAYLRDPYGNRLCIYHAGKNRQFPPWRVKHDSA
jgi:catechol 2,3-dioxygenase-like lactoylglutathione lyase family enzyme